MKISLVRPQFSGYLSLTFCNYTPLFAATDATKSEANASMLVTITSTRIPEIPTEISLNPLFGDHMVLQRDMPANIWGQAAPGEKIRIHLNGKVVAATADAQRNWRAKLPA